VLVLWPDRKVVESKRLKAARSKWLSWTTALLDERGLRLGSARRKGLSIIVDRDVERRSRKDARYHQHRAAWQVLPPRLLQRFHCLPPRQIPGRDCAIRCAASSGLDERLLSSPRSDKAVTTNYRAAIAAELGCVLLRQQFLSKKTVWKHGLNLQHASTPDMDLLWNPRPTRSTQGCRSAPTLTAMLPAKAFTRGR
jgi:hypothetical protein